MPRQVLTTPDRANEPINTQKVRSWIITYPSADWQGGIFLWHGNQVSAHGLGKSPKQVVEMSRRGVTTERQRKMRTKTHSQNSTNFGCTNVLFLVQKQSYAPSIRIIIDESTRQFNMIFDRASFDAVSFLYNLIRFNTIFRTIFRVCCMFRFSTLQ